MIGSRSRRSQCKPGLLYSPLALQRRITKLWLQSIVSFQASNVRLGDARELYLQPVVEPLLRVMVDLGLPVSHAPLSFIV